VNRASQRLRTLLRPHPGWFVLLAAIGLTYLGIVAMRTASVLPNQPDWATQQTRWLLIALVGMVAALAPDPRGIGRAAYPLLAGAIVLTVITVLPFMPETLVPVRNGARHWINLRFMMLQPSELTKLAFILALARYLRHRESYRTLSGLLPPFLIMFLPLGLVLKQPDMGTALLFPPILFAMLIAAGARLKHIGWLLGLGLAIVALSIASIYLLPESMQLLERHQRMRIVSLVSQFQGDARYLSGPGYQQNKAQTLIGSGQVLGLAEQRSATMIRFNFLPEAHNDMIFAVIVNRWGLVGGLMALGLYALLIGSLWWVALRNKDPFARLCVVGFGSLVLTQATINIGMSLGLLPIIGITLPLVSYGGSSLVATFAMIGLAVGFAAQRPAIITQPSFEFDGAQAVSD